ncbi:hypothetical protein SCHIN_v1c00690 [Spiroplasma chinense]|uniref:Transmembrane protein n=1 Tax=Spiroplasma chinense TaxID=216932 RepID=A0A5B9Y4T2_9MOLU|nr:hypothetical protein [Spiroplasma chinense]QEH61267.1 hypothetical protein SCHIN_v1c00690 [Spiroplasma chinense]
MRKLLIILSAISLTTTLPSNLLVSAKKVDIIGKNIESEKIELEDVRTSINNTFQQLLSEEKSPKISKSATVGAETEKSSFSLSEEESEIVLSKANELLEKLTNSNYELEDYMDFVLEESSEFNEEFKKMQLINNDFILPSEISSVAKNEDEKSNRALDLGGTLGNENQMIDKNKNLVSSLKNVRRAINTGGAAAAILAAALYASAPWLFYSTLKAAIACTTAALISSVAAASITVMLAIYYKDSNDHEKFGNVFNAAIIVGFKLARAALWAFEVYVLGVIPTKWAAPFLAAVVVTVTTTWDWTRNNY